MIQPKEDVGIRKEPLLSKPTEVSPGISKYVNPERLYVPPVKEGAVMNARGLAEVVDSKSSSHKKGDIVIASTGWSEYSIHAAKTLQPAPDLPGGKVNPALGQDPH